MAITIRDATTEDKLDVVELIREFAGEWAEESPITIAFVERYLTAHNDFILIAEWNGSCAGLLSYSLRLNLWHAAPCCYIADVVVTKPYRGKGIGTELISHILKKANAEGYAEVSLTVDPGNTRAQALYKRLGIDEVVIGLEKHMG